MLVHFWNTDGGGPDPADSMRYGEDESGNPRKVGAGVNAVPDGSEEDMRRTTLGMVRDFSRSLGSISAGLVVRYSVYDIQGIDWSHQFTRQMSDAAKKSRSCNAVNNAENESRWSWLFACEVIAQSEQLLAVQGNDDDRPVTRSGNLFESSLGGEKAGGGWECILEPIEHREPRPAVPVVAEMRGENASQEFG
ncbi:hypothetical protein C8J56DRAFT_894364 [Mycena floridula]|nr:hypothetical protein C8J56DRAFT_894364 [Mycena floridula]